MSDTETFAPIGDAVSGVIAKVAKRMDQYRHWREALAAKRPVESGELLDGTFVRSGYYAIRSKVGKHEALAFWREDDRLYCVRQKGHSPTDLDQIAELYARCSMNPISYDLYQSVAERGEPWPDQISKSEAAPGEIGHNSQNAEPHELIQGKINDLVDSARKWLAEIGGKIATQDHADKACNYSEEFAKLEKTADKARVAEKEPHDEAAKAVQTKWKPIVDTAAEKKVWMKKAFEVYAIAERKRLAEEAARKAEEERKAAEEARAQGQEPEPAAAVQEPIKVNAGTAGRRVALKTRTVYVVTDVKTFAAELAGMNQPPAEFVETLRKIANRMGAAGAKPAGVEARQEEYAA